MIVFILAMLVVYGLILGSFVNALVWRLHAQEELRDKIIVAEDTVGKLKGGRSKVSRLRSELKALSMTKGRSMCSGCRHPLAPVDLVPLFSWIWLVGKCRYCHRPIEDPPLVELVLPVLFVLSYVFWPLTLSLQAPGYGLFAFVLWLVFLVGFMALALYDIRWFLLPDKIVWPLVGLALVQVVVHATVFDGGWPVIMQALWGVAIASGVFWVLFQIAERLKREWIGFGDVKLGIVLGLLVGGPLEAILLLYIASLLGLAVSLPLMLKSRLKRTSLIPYGPFLLAACVIVTLAGPVLTGWLDKLFLMPI